MSSHRICEAVLIVEWACNPLKMTTGRACTTMEQTHLDLDLLGLAFARMVLWPDVLDLTDLLVLQHLILNRSLQLMEHLRFLLKHEKTLANLRITLFSG